MKKNLFRILFLSLLIVLLTFMIIHWKKNEARNDLTRLYEQGLQINYNKQNLFCPPALIAYCDSFLSIPGHSGYDLMAVQFSKGLALLKEGNETEAITLLDSLAEKLKVDKNGQLATNTRKFLALAYIRKAERNNCINNHTNGSCIFPIQGNGIYTDTGFTEKAIGVYNEILRMDSADLESRWLLNIAYMAIGKYPDALPAAWLIPGLDTNSSPYHIIPFQNIAGNLKINEFRNQSGGTIVDDMDNDGYLDIITSSWGLDEAMHYFKNNADGTFTDLSEKSGLNKIKGGLNIMQADYNNDGYTDILVLRGAWMGEFGLQPNTLLKNNGDGTFTDVTIESGLLSFHPTQTAVWADFNNDGWLDLFIGNETVSPVYPHPSELFLNNQDGSFTNVAAQAACDIRGFVKGVSAGDYNRDGAPDLFISMLQGGKILLKNTGVKSRIPKFEDVTQQAGLNRDTTHSFPTWFWDYNNDGWPDIFVCGFDFSGSLDNVLAAEALHLPRSSRSMMYLYKNNGDGSFTNVSKETGLDKPVFAMGSNFGDFDNDGWPDMYLGTGNPDLRSLIPNKLFKNVDGKYFSDVTTAARMGNLQKGHGVAFADLDNDGDQDIFIETGGAYSGDAYFNSLYLNPGQNQNNWLCLLLEGVQTNRSAIGVHIAATFLENGIKRTVYKDVNSGGSFGASPLRKEIGIGTATLVQELTISWPSTGKQQVFKNVLPNQFYRIREGMDNLEKRNIRKLVFDTKNMNMIDCAPEKK